MTIVIGLKTADRIYIASDSRVTNVYNDLISDDKEKVLEFTYLGKPLIAGISGGMFHCNRIIHEFVASEDGRAHHRFDYEFSDFVLQYRKDHNLEDKDYAQFVVAYDNELYVLTGVNTLESHRVAVIGSTIDFAEGYIRAELHANANIEESLKSTVNACAKHNLSVGGPVQIKSMPILA